MMCHVERDPDQVGFQSACSATVIIKLESGKFQIRKMRYYMDITRVSEIPSHHIKKALKGLESGNTVNSIPSVLEPF